MTLKQILKYFNTLRFLKVKQIVFQLFYRFYKSPFRLIELIQENNKLDVMHPSYPFGEINNCDNGMSFSFLNNKKCFEDSINWDFSDYGKLWTYNLNYFDFLFSEDVSDSDKHNLIQNYVDSFSFNNTGKEPYTISLRGYNWIKYLSSSTWCPDNVVTHLYSQYDLLFRRFEYHLLANHLLENALSMLFAAYFFNDKRFYAKAKKVLKCELDEQICDDGCHYERSVMYHCILLYRLLESVYLVQNNRNFIDEEFDCLLLEKVNEMFSFYKKIVYSTGDIPMFNDAIRGNVISSKLMNSMASKIRGFDASGVGLKDSGFRRFTNVNFEMTANLEGVLPKYQPGHYHADIGSFELYYKGQPIIVDMGTSTYEASFRRQIERSTLSHNTVTVNDINQSDVWGGFRVAQRAKVIDMVDLDMGAFVLYSPANSNILFKREFIYDDADIQIKDCISNTINNGVARLFFNYNCNLKVISNTEIQLADGLIICFSGCSEINLTSYMFAQSYSKTIKAPLIEIAFFEKLTTTFKIQ